MNIQYYESVKLIDLVTENQISSPVPFPGVASHRAIRLTKQNSPKMKKHAILSVES